MSSDTPLDVEIELDRLFATRSGSERVRMACGMFDSARAMAVGAIRAARPDIGDASLRVELFDRLYGGEIDGDWQHEVRQRLARGAGTEGLDAERSRPTEGSD
ncbi:MAG: hypothetical protein IT176_07455 [Acidobacteria bacterium]|nr:hypothetical protein [Acidobacteriota bacterium]